MCLETKAFIGQVSATLNCKYMCKIETDWLMCLLSQKNNVGTTQQFCIGKSTKKNENCNWQCFLHICYQFSLSCMYYWFLFFCTSGLAFTFIVFEHLCFYDCLFTHHLFIYFASMRNTWSKLTYIIVAIRNTSWLVTCLSLKHP